MIAKDFSKLVTNFAQDPKHYAKAYASYVDSKVRINREIYEVFLNLYRYGGLINEDTGEINIEVFPKDYWNVPLWIKPLKINDKTGNYDNMMISGLRLAKAIQGKLQEDDPLTIELTYDTGNTETSVRDMLMDYGMDVASLESDPSKEVSLKLKTNIICNGENYNKGSYVAFNKDDLDSVVYVVRSSPIVIQALVTSFLDQQVETIIKADSVIAILDLLGSKDSITVSDIESKLNTCLGSFQGYDRYVNREVLSIAQNTLLSGDERIKQVMSILNDEVVKEEEDSTNQVYFDDELELIFNANAYTGTEASAMWSASCASDAIQNSVAVVGRIIGATGKVIYSVTKTVASAVSRLWRKYVTPAYQSKDFVKTESDDVDAYVDVPLIIQGDVSSGVLFDKTSLQKTALLNLTTPITKTGSLNMNSILYQSAYSMRKPNMVYNETTDNNLYFKVTKTGVNPVGMVTFNDTQYCMDYSGRTISLSDAQRSPHQYNLRHDLGNHFQTFNYSNEALYDSIAKHGGISSFNLQSKGGVSINMGGLGGSYNLNTTNTISRNFELSIVDRQLVLSYQPAVVTGHFEMRWADRESMNLLSLPNGFDKISLIYNSLQPLDPMHATYYFISNDGVLHMPGCLPTDNDSPIEVSGGTKTTQFKFVIYSEANNAWIKMGVTINVNPPVYADSTNYSYGSSTFSIAAEDGGYYDVTAGVVPEWNNPAFMQSSGGLNVSDELSFVTPGVYDVILVNISRQISGDNVKPIIDGFMLKDGRQFQTDGTDPNSFTCILFREVEKSDTYYVGASYCQGEGFKVNIQEYECYHSVEVTYLPMYGDGHSTTVICSFVSNPIFGNSMNDYYIEYQTEDEYYDPNHIKFHWDGLMWSWYSAPITELSESTVNQILNDVSAPIDEGTALTIKNAFMCMQMINKDDVIRTMIYLVPITYSIFFNSALEWRLKYVDHSSNLELDGELINEAKLNNWLCESLSGITKPRDNYDLEAGDVVAWKDLMAARKLVDFYLWCLANPNLVINDYFKDFNTTGWMTKCDIEIPVDSINNAQLVNVAHAVNFNSDRLSEALYSIMLGAISMKPSYMRALYLLTGEFPEFNPYLIGDRLLTPRWHISTDDDIQGYVDKICTALVLTAAVIAAAVLLKVGSVAVKKFFMKKQASLDIRQLQATQHGTVCVDNLRNQEKELRLLKEMSKDSSLSPEDRAAYKELWKEANAKLKQARKSMNSATTARYKIDRSRGRWTKVAGLFGVTLSSSDTLMTAVSTEAILGDNESSFYNLTESMSDSLNEEVVGLEDSINANHTNIMNRTDELHSQNARISERNQEIQQSVSEVKQMVAALGVVEVMQLLCDKVDAIGKAIGGDFSGITTNGSFNLKDFED